MARAQENSVKLDQYPETPPADGEAGEWVNAMAVLLGSTESGFEQVFTGTRSQCYEFMKSHKEGADWTDLAYCKTRDRGNDVDVVIGRLSSWVLLIL